MVQWSIQVHTSPLYCWPCRSVDSAAYDWREATSTDWSHLHQDRPPQSSGVWRILWEPYQWHICTWHGDMGMKVYVSVHLICLLWQCTYYFAAGDQEKKHVFSIWRGSYRERWCIYFVGWLKCMEISMSVYKHVSAQLFAWYEVQLYKYKKNSTWHIWMKIERSNNTEWQAFIEQCMCKIQIDKFILSCDAYM